MNSELKQLVAVLEASTEAEARRNLAALYRLAVFYGWESHIFNHIAARVPGEPAYLVKPHSLMFREVRASNLLKLRLDGAPMDETMDVNAAGFTIHTAVLNARSDINYTIHVHTNAGAAFSAQKQTLQPMYQRAMVFYNRLSYHDFEGIASDVDEAARLARDLGPRNKAVVLRNHGLLTAGETASECMTLMRYLVESCEIQLALQQAHSEVVIPSPDVCEDTARKYERFQRDVDAVEWGAYLRHAESIDPSYHH